MNAKEFLSLRQRLQKTQKEMSHLLGTSLRSIQSFEQGWRKVPGHIERQIFFLVAMKNGMDRNPSPCWEIMKCALPQRTACPAWEIRAGHLCWYINGTFCHGKVQKNWAQKMKLCRKCKVWAKNLGI